jgi:hypothetical protein
MADSRTQGKEAVFSIIWNVHFLVTCGTQHGFKDHSQTRFPKGETDCPRRSHIEHIRRQLVILKNKFPFSTEITVSGIQGLNERCSCLFPQPTARIEGDEAKAIL